jgi:small subunit ribosomal protein S17
MDKTCIVSVERTFNHKNYGKVTRRKKKYYAHDEANACGIGDKVKIMETRPLSKLKRWRVVEVLEKAARI